MTESEPGGSSSTSGTPPGAQENPNMSDNSTNTWSRRRSSRNRRDGGPQEAHRQTGGPRRSGEEEAFPGTGSGSQEEEGGQRNRHPLRVPRQCQQKIQSAKCEREHLDTNDCDIMFLLCLRDNIKNLSPQKKALAKIRIQQILFDLEFPDPRGTMRPWFHPSNRRRQMFIHHNGLFTHAAERYKLALTSR
ncbi:hypothetical protein HPB47_019100 [Ixodes persulcatus]|uniref:Uncharacterized protein n=1 Tax=Ixodes persulcatus TaxID=34615 RepID=A0AC60QJ09_IXOPE|nr:hypothetical protein HPB47_019100 [Ixodes persulcatus]